MEWAREQDGAWAFAHRALAHSLMEDSRMSSRDSRRQNRAAIGSPRQLSLDMAVDGDWDLLSDEVSAGEAEDPADVLVGAVGIGKS